MTRRRAQAAQHANTILSRRALARRNGTCACGEPFAEPPPRFNYDEVKGMTADEVRRRFPRHMSHCVKCGSDTIRYASFIHYMCGDW